MSMILTEKQKQIAQIARELFVRHEIVPAVAFAQAENFLEYQDEFFKDQNKQELLMTSQKRD